MTTSHDNLADTMEPAAMRREEGTAATPSTNSPAVVSGDRSKPPRSCRARRIWADAAKQLNVDASVIEQLIFRGGA